MLSLLSDKLKKFLTFPTNPVPVCLNILYALCSAVLKSFLFNFCLASITDLSQWTKLSAFNPFKADNSKWVWALTKAGKIALSPKSTHFP